MAHFSIIRHNGFDNRSEELVGEMVTHVIRRGRMVVVLGFPGRGRIEAEESEFRCRLSRGIEIVAGWTREIYPVECGHWQ